MVNEVTRNAPAAELRDGSLLGAERRRLIVELLTEQGSVDVASLAVHFDVTQETVRRDLTLLEQQGVLHRVHGGAILALSGHAVPSLPIRRSLMAAEKDQIARAALQHVPADGAVLLDAGSTTGRLAELMPGGRPLSILTNALPIAIALAGKPGLVVHTVGGRVRPSTLAEVDAVALRTLSEVSVDVAFMATSGVTDGHGFSTTDPSEAAAKRAMIKAAKRVIVLSDHTKIGIDHFARFAEFTDVDLLITDAEADLEVVRRFEMRGLAVEIASRASDRSSRAASSFESPRKRSRSRSTPVTSDTILEGKP